jgi:murein DD-endopeptidase MepM/ murein hydrolase activator NlpD
MRWKLPSAATLRRWAWWVGFVLRMMAAAVLVGAVLVLLLRHRETTALVRYVEPPSELLVPVQGVARSALRSSWGDPRSGHRHHEGIDIFATRGTPVLAATAGEVTRVGHDHLGGNVIWIAGAGARLYYYAHLDRFAPDVHPGTEVSAGRIIGFVGNTGDARTTPPHLHFGVYPAGHAFRAVDPYPLLQAHEIARSETDAAR